MYERCPVCGLTYEREEGYFIGAMYVSYGLAIPPYLAIVSALWLLARWRYEMALLGAVVVYLPFVPMVMRLSRVVWIYIDQAFDPVTFNTARVRNPGYYRIDLGATYHVFPKRGNIPALDVTARINNVTDQRYAEVFGFPNLGINALVGVQARY